MPPNLFGRAAAVCMIAGRSRSAGALSYASGSRGHRARHHAIRQHQVEGLAGLAKPRPRLVAILGDD